MSNKNNRFAEIDLWRGIAVIGMIVFHVFYILDYFEVIENNMRSGWWLLLARFVQISFLLLVGISMAISMQRNLKAGYSKQHYYFKQWKRAMFVLLCAMIVSLATWVFDSERFVRFGILHLIAVGIFIFSLIANKKKLALGLGAGALLFGLMIDKIHTVDSVVLGTFGFQTTKFLSFDYFPIFPWISAIAIGIALGNFIYKNAEQRWNLITAGKFFIVRDILFLGRHSLAIYMTHLPVIVAGVYLLKPLL